MLPPLHPDPLLAQVLTLESDKRTLLLREGQMQASKKGRFFRGISKLAKTEEKAFALDAVNHLRDSLNVELKHRQHISVISAQRLIRQPDLDSISIASGFSGTSSCESESSGFDSGISDLDTLSTCSEFSTLTTDSEDKPCATAREPVPDDEVVRSKPRKKKNVNVSFADTVEEVPVFTTKQLVREENACFETVIEAAVNSGNFAQSIEQQYQTMNPEEMCDFRQFLTNTFEEDDIKEHLSEFMDTSRMAIPLKLLEQDFLKSPKDEVSSAVMHFSQGPHACSSFICKFRWLRIHLGNPNIMSIAKRMCDYFKEQPDHFDQAHFERAAEIQSILAKKGAPDILKSKITLPPTDSEPNKNRLSDVWTKYAFDATTKDEFLKEIDLPELTGDRHVHDILQTLTLDTRKRI